MIAFVIAATIILGLAAAVFLVLNKRGHETRRLALLSGMITTLLLAPVAKLLPLAPPPSFSIMPVGVDAHEVGGTVLFLWLVGLALMLARLFWNAVLATRLRRVSRTLHDDDAAWIADTLGITRDEIARRFRITDGIHTPMVLAGLRQTVLLPVSWCQWSRGLQVSALRHEWRHVRGADAQWSVVAALLRAVFWFHPLSWWVSARWAEQCEHLADRAAASGRPAEDYAQELLSLATTEHDGGHILGVAFISRSRSRLERRVRAVLDESTRGLPCGRIAHALLLLFFATAGLSLAAMLAPKTAPQATSLENEARTRLIANPFPGDR